MKYILYAEDGSSEVKVVPNVAYDQVEDEYRKIVKNHSIRFQTGSRISNVTPSFVALVDEVWSHNYITGESISGPDKSDEET